MDGMYTPRMVNIQDAGTVPAATGPSAMRIGTSIFAKSRLGKSQKLKFRPQITRRRGRAAKRKGASSPDSDTQGFSGNGGKEDEC
ncbi:MAG TPA: hypothetical protein PK919_09130 [Candidatus Aminicenantes bacterium]|nr:hypothetical protein [Candidatus Aminicenantes bacterium]